MELTSGAYVRVGSDRLANACWSQGRMDRCNSPRHRHGVEQVERVFIDPCVVRGPTIDTVGLWFADYEILLL